MAETTVHQLWQKACVVLQKNMSPSSYTTWILSSPLTDFRVVGNDRAIGVITSPTAFHSTNVEKNFYAQIKEVLDEVSGLNSELQFRIGTPEAQEDKVVSISVSPSVSVSVSSTEGFSGEIGAPSYEGVRSSVETLERFEHVESIGHVEEKQPVFSQNLQNSQNQPLSPGISSMQERLRQFASQEIRQPGSPNTPSPFRYESPASHTLSPNAADLFSQTSMQSVSVDRARLQAQRAGLRPDYT